MTTNSKEKTCAQHPEELHQLFTTYVNAHDVEGLIALYEPDFIAADLEGHLLRDAESLRAFLTGFLAAVEHIDGETRKAIVAGDIALLSSSWSTLLPTPDGGTNRVTGTSTEIARRQPNGNWLFVIDDPQF